MIKIYHQQTACINEAAAKYNLDPKEVEKYVKLRQNQGKKTKVEGKKYRFYIICRISEDAENHRKVCYMKPFIEKSLSKEKLIEKYKEEDDYKSKKNTYSDKFSTLYHTDFLGDAEGYETKKECENVLDNYKELLQDRGYIYNN